MTRDALVGAVIGAAFGALWTVFGSAGLPALWRGLLVLLAIAVLVTVVLRVLRARRSAPPPDRGGGASMFATTRYRVVLVLTLVALFGGNLLLNAAGLGTYTICWTAFVVGVHFLVFARLFGAAFGTLGAVTTAIAAAGALVGVAGGSPLAVSVITGVGVGLFFLGGSLHAVLAR